MGVDDLIKHTEPRDSNGVLHLASVAIDSDMFEFLIVQGARTDVQDRRGRTPLMLAAELGHVGKKNADMKLVDKEGALFPLRQPPQTQQSRKQRRKTALSCTALTSDHQRQAQQIGQQFCAKNNLAESADYQPTNRKASRRQRFTYEVEFDDFKMPFNKTIQKKSLELEFTE
ncbi:ankyrin repeat and EF-hand domain-containing protein 1-like [Myxocyprinus asiaticus]|uniref:ankyrin repeat and EF-hand domain-containing protein 1-like n=1 Tax=Myxocyprinus asiaticus TaxID=70543 RepID=UPI002222BBB0|nr:ankyrin repeat and EF-hand domain-containing protein 1-like [Myxocyprinus asiaticus]